MELNDKIVIYRTADGQTSIDVKLEDETVWLSANQMANLFDRDEKTIRKHINNVFSEGELEKEKRGCLKMYCTPKVRHKTFGVFFMKYSYEQRLIIVSRVKQGELIAHLSKEYHINKTQILAWVRMWDKYGRSGLEQQPHCRPTVKLKEEVVRLILEKGVPLSHVRIEYRIGKTALQRWVSTVRKYGYEALAPSKRQGRALKEPMGRPKKKEPQTELERLQAENLRLRAENALLKKAKALVEAKKAQALLNGREPSTN